MYHRRAELVYGVPQSLSACVPNRTVKWIHQTPPPSHISNSWEAPCCLLSTFSRSRRGWGGGRLRWPAGTPGGGCTRTSGNGHRPLGSSRRTGRSVPGSPASPRRWTTQRFPLFYSVHNTLGQRCCIFMQHISTVNVLHDAFYVCRLLTNGTHPDTQCYQTLIITHTSPKVIYEVHCNFTAFCNGKTTVSALTFRGDQVVVLFSAVLMWCGVCVCGLWRVWCSPFLRAGLRCTGGKPPGPGGSCWDNHCTDCLQTHPHDSTHSFQEPTNDKRATKSHLDQILTCLRSIVIVIEGKQRAKPNHYANIEHVFYKTFLTLCHIFEVIWRYFKHKIAILLSVTSYPSYLSFLTQPKWLPCPNLF